MVIKITQSEKTQLNKLNENINCAPSKKLENGSCFTLETLIDIAHSFNSYIIMKLINKQKIEIINNKQYLIEQLTDRLKDICKNELCWIKQDFIKNTKNKKEILNNTFRPQAPNGRFTWLSTSNIDKVINQYHDIYKDFKFLGAVPMDFDKLLFLGIKNLNFDNLYNNNIYKIGIIFNTDNHNQTGSHWIALFANLKEFKIYYFDSYGEPPENRVREFVKRIAVWCHKKHKNKHLPPSDKFMVPNKKNNYEQLTYCDIRYNTKKHQKGNSECGVFSINFILRLLKGVSFDEHNNLRIPDEDINTCRSVYFNNSQIIVQPHDIC